MSGTESSKSLNKNLNTLNTPIEIPCDSNFGSKPRPVAYDFTELGKALGDTVGGYKNTITHPAPGKGCSGEGPDTEPGPGKPNQCPSDATGTYPSCACTTAGFTYNESKNDCLPVAGPGEKPGTNPLVPAVIADANIGRHKDAVCDQEDPLSSAVTCTLPSGQTSTWSLWVNNEATVLPLDKFVPPTWNVSPGSWNIEIWLTKSPKCSTASEGKFPTSPAGHLFVYSASPADKQTWKEIKADCTVRISLKNSPDGINNGESPTYIEMPQPGNWILKPTTSQNSITIKTFSAGKLNGS